MTQNDNTHGESTNTARQHARYIYDFRSQYYEYKKVSSNIDAIKVALHILSLIYTNSEVMSQNHNMFYQRSLLILVLML